MSEVGIEASLNRWDEPLALGVVDPHDSLSHPAGVSDVQTETATCLDPDQFTDYLVGLFFQGEKVQRTVLLRYVSCNHFLELFWSTYQDIVL